MGGPIQLHPYHRGRRTERVVLTEHDLNEILNRAIGEETERSIKRWLDLSGTDKMQALQDTIEQLNGVVDNANGVIQRLYTAIKAAHAKLVEIEKQYGDKTFTDLVDELSKMIGALKALEPKKG